MREKCFWQARISRRGAELQAPFHVQVPCEDRKWKNEKRKITTLQRWLHFFPLKPALLATAAILLLLYFAGTHNSMTCHESSDWRRVVTILYFRWLLQISNPCKRLWSGEDLQIEEEAPLTDPASGIPEAQNLWGRPNNRNCVKVTSIFHNVWNILKQPGFEATVCEGFVSSGCLKVDLDSA